MMTACLQEGAILRISLLVLIWLCFLGTIVQVLLLGYELRLLLSGITFSELTVLALLTEHIAFLFWIADIIYAIFGVEFADLILALPATLVTIFKLVFGALIGYWALDTLRELDSSQGTGGKVQSTH